MKLYLILLIFLMACGNPFGKKGPLKFQTIPDDAATQRRRASEALERENAQKKAWSDIEIFANNSFKEVRPIFEKKCISCHDSTFKLPFYGRIFRRKNPITKHQIDGIKALDYANNFPLKAQGNPSQLVLLKSIKHSVVERTMPLKIYTAFYPKRKISDKDEEKIIAWIDPLIERLEEYERKYTVLDQSIQGRTVKLFEQKCFQCHANGNARGSFGGMQDTASLIKSKYVDLNDPMKSVLYVVSENKEMPPNQNEALNAEELTLLQDWLESFKN